MTIECKICGKVFKSLISSTHLNTHHMKTSEYKDLYGKDSVASSEYRASRSGKTGENNPNFGNKWSDDQKQIMSGIMKGNVPWNKGLTFDDTSIQQNAAKKREERYLTGELLRPTVNHSNETKKKIGSGVAAYAAENKDELCSRAKKSVQTKRDNNYDFGKNMRGQHHSQETRDKISEVSKKTAVKKNISRIEAHTERMTEINISLCSVESQFYRLRCNTCDTEFTLTSQYFTHSKFNEKICPCCYPRSTNRSAGEIEVFNFVKEFFPDAINNCRTIINGEIDIYIPSRRVAVEYNGLYWHSEGVLEYNGKHRLSDLHKYELLLSLGIRPVVIFEDEWLNNPEIVKSRLKSILGVIDQKIYGRHCETREIDSHTASNFCKMNHIQGTGRSNKCYGLFHNSELVSVMTFSKSNISRKVYDWEINRFCNTVGINVVGAASKLFKKFVNEVKPATVVSYADRRWSAGNVYEVLGFSFVENTVANYWYVYPNTGKRIHRYSLRKKSCEPRDKTEVELRTAEGYFRIWDCGHSRWEWICPT